ncbi:MAG TPA: DUF2252 domain-containing protein [Thermoanaerobaculia bacterium]|nr:DUF2252 domain-containing protein [Thermoanaerobaculia bacterium]
MAKSAAAKRSPSGQSGVPTPADRRERGRKLRRRVARSAHGDWKPDARRPDPVVLLQEANTERLPALVPIKITRMSLSPFSFYRGAAPLMALDLSKTPDTGLRTQLCGDAHVQNVGAFAAPDGHLVFDLNDFDETIPGPWEWDIKRMATSLVLAGREAGNGDRENSDAVRAFVLAYREAMSRFAEMTFLEIVRYQVKRYLRAGPAHVALARAERASPQHALAKLTVPDGRGLRRFHDRSPILRHVPDRIAADVIRSLTSYRETLSPDRQLAMSIYRPVDVAFKVVGTGSVGTRDYVVLMFGGGPHDPLMIQVKEELPSCYHSYLPDVRPFEHQGRRVAEGQHRMQSATDPFLGWTSLEGRDYLVRQLADHKAKVEVTDLKGVALTRFALVTGEILGKAHARTGDAASIAGYCGRSDRLDKAIARFALRYADQTEKDYGLFRRAIRSGVLKAAPRREAIG